MGRGDRGGVCTPASWQGPWAERSRLPLTLAIPRTLHHPELAIGLGENERAINTLTGLPTDTGNPGPGLVTKCLSSKGIPCVSVLAGFALEGLLAASQDGPFHGWARAELSLPPWRFPLWVPALPSKAA